METGTPIPHGSATTLKPLWLLLLLSAVCTAACTEYPTEVLVTIEYDRIGGTEGVDSIQLSGLSQQSMAGPQDEVTLRLADDAGEFELFVEALDVDASVVGVSRVQVVPSAGQTVTVVVSLEPVECDIATVCAPTEVCVRGLCVSMDVDAGPNDAGTDTFSDAGPDGGPDPDAGPEPDAGPGPDAGPTPLACPSGDTVLFDDFERDVAGSRVLVGATIDSLAPRCGSRSVEITTANGLFRYATEEAFNSSSGSLDFFMKLPSGTFAATEYVVARDAVGTESNHFSAFIFENRLIVRAQTTGLTVHACSAALPRDTWLRVGINWGEGGLELWTNRERASATDTVNFEGRSGVCGTGADLSVGLSGLNPLVFGARQSRSGEGPDHTIPSKLKNTSFDGLRIDHVRWSSVRRDYTE